MIASISFFIFFFLYSYGPVRIVQEEVDATFFVASDLHYEQNENTAEINRLMAAQMASLPGTLYPDFSEKVAPPESISLTGDIIEDRKPEEWDDFTSALD